MSRFTAVVGALLAVAALPACAEEEHIVKKTIETGGRERAYRLHVPPSYSKEKPVPLVLMFHGGGGSSSGMESLTHFGALSDREGFIVAYPDAVEGNWNDGREDFRSEARKLGVDDVAFVAALIDALSAEYAIDPKRIFASGISNGAIMSHCLGARLSRRFAAIAPVVGGMATGVAEAFAPEEPVSVLVLQGTDDPLVPYDGGGIGFFGGRGTIVSTKRAIDLWVAHDGCGAEPAVEDLPDRDPEDGTRIHRSTWTGGKNGTEVVLLRIEGGGHTWPTGPQYLPRSVIGRTSKDIDATAVIWEFFAGHPKP